MLYGRIAKTPFMDTADINKTHVPYRESPNSPFILKPKFDKPAAERSHAARTVFVNRRHRKADLRDIGVTIGKTLEALYGDVLTHWKFSMRQLNEIATETDAAAELEKASGRAVMDTFIKLVTAYQLRPEDEPELASSGDGGIHIEWNLKDKFISIQIDKESDDRDRIYIEQNGKYGSTEFSTRKLMEVFEK